MKPEFVEAMLGPNAGRRAAAPTVALAAEEVGTRAWAAGPALAREAALPGTRRKTAHGRRELESCGPRRALLLSARLQQPSARLL